MNRFQQIFTFAVGAPDQLPLSEQAIYDLKNTIRKANEMIDFTDPDEDYNEYEETESDAIDSSSSSSMSINSTATNRTESLPRACASASFRVPMYIYSLLGLLLIQTKQEQWNVMCYLTTDRRRRRETLSASRREKKIIIDSYFSVWSVLPDTSKSARQRERERELVCRATGWMTYITEVFQNSFARGIVDSEVVDGFINLSSLNNEHSSLFTSDRSSLYFDCIEHILQGNLLLQWIVNGNVSRRFVSLHWCLSRDMFSWRTLEKCFQRLILLDERILSLFEFSQLLLIVQDLTFKLVDRTCPEVFPLFSQLMHLVSLFIEKKTQLFQIIVGRRWTLDDGFVSRLFVVFDQCLEAEGLHRAREKTSITSRNIVRWGLVLIWNRGEHACFVSLHKGIRLKTKPCTSKQQHQKRESERFNSNKYDDRDSSEDVGKSLDCCSHCSCCSSRHRLRWRSRRDCVEVLCPKGKDDSVDEDDDGDDGNDAGEIRDCRMFDSHREIVGGKPMNTIYWPM